LHPPEWLAQQGLYYTPTSLKSRYTATCSTCGTVISQPLLKSTEVARLHLQQSPQCPIARIWVYRSSNDRDDKLVDTAFIPDVTAAQGVAVRESTFTNNGIWTHEFPDVDTMTQSGLYYDPLSERLQEDGTVILDDRVICMYCGLNLEEWERGDDVVSAHRDANPACYVFRSKGELVPIQAPVSDSRYSPGVDFDVHMHDENDDDDMPAQFDNADEYGDNNIPIRDLEGEDHSVVSIESATTTTTTTALPVEIVEVDEVEEYLLQDDRRDATSRDVRTVEIPSVKSSELSQFFTEMDLESEHEAGASYFAARKKQRMAESQHGLERTNLEPMVAEEDEKVHEEQQVAEQVEEIEEVEETEKEVAGQPEQTSSVGEPAQLASDGKDDANDDDIDMNHNDFDFDVNSHDYSAFQQLIPQNDVIDVISAKLQKDAEAAASADVDEDAVLGDVATVDANKVNGIIEVNNVPDNDIATPAPTNKEDATALISDAHALGDVSKEVVVAPASVSDDTSNKEAELSRVKQLESELKLLKLQIEKLQNQSVPVISHKLQPAESGPTRSEEPVVNNDVVESEREELQLANGPTEIETEDVVEEEKNEEATTEKSQINTGNEIASEKVLEHEEMEVDQSPLIEMGIKIEEENPADAYKTQAVIKEEKVDSQLPPPPLKKSNKNKTKKEKKKRGHDVEEIRDDDPLAFKPKKARHKKKKRSIRREKEVPAADDAETVIKIEPTIGLAADDAENTSRNETSEIPTEADQSKQDQRTEDVSNGEHFLQSGFVPGAHRVKKSNIEENYHHDDAEKENVNPTTFENDESYNDTSPTLLRKNAERRTKEKEKHETKGLNDNSNLAFQLDLGLNLSHEYIANNQSTPYASNVRNALEMSSENPPIAPSTAATSGEKLGVSDIAPESTSWAPLDSSKCHTVYADVKEAVGYVKEVLESPYELLGEDLDGLLTEFVGAIPPEQLGMSVREWMRCQEEQAVALVEEKAELLQRQLHAARAAAEAYLETL
jgi:hypothetical protein